MATGLCHVFMRTGELIARGGRGMEDKLVLKPKDKLLIDTKELCQVLGIGTNTARELIRKPDFPVLYVGNRARVVVSKLDKWLEDNVGADIG